jgi:hypothetical protein
MKAAKINVPALVGVFCVVGLAADLLPYPGLQPGVVVTVVNRAIAVIRPANTTPEANAELAMTRVAETSAAALTKVYPSGQ